MSEFAHPAAQSPRADRRVARTRAALVSAFNHLVLERGYEATSAADVAQAADVGRSTFYDHYRGKEDLLAESLAGVLAPLADCGFQAEPSERLSLVVEHLWQNRRMARALLSGRTADAVATALTGLIEERLAGRGGSLRGSLGGSFLPNPLVAAQIAGATLALISAWLSGRHGGTAAAVATAIYTSSRTIVRLS